ncbi:24-hydroxycholesterol 7-alpha-hydroxylase isoform 2-T2 [Leptodactylus fuscus]|uniref:24-hydroxycholesterol 7-alpha-hydroxylase isoform X2 n=1 Tax=Leptodactylus fuscus TaxID=238119 RepID=UPI003F4ED869
MLQGMDVLYPLLGLLLALLAGFLTRRHLTRKSPSLPAPPCISGWIPWLGAALEMGKAPLEFIEQARQKHGPVFTVTAAGNRLTFVSGEEAVSKFFTSKQVDFQQAVQKPVQYTASIGKKSFYKSHSAIHDMIKLRLSQNRLNPYIPRLCQEFSAQLEQLESQGTEELYDLVRDWSQSKQWLLNLFKNIVAEAEHNKPSEDSRKTLLHHLLDTLKGNATYNNSLLLLWASQANANPITFWSLAFMVSDPEVYRKVMNEVTSVFGEAGQQPLNITEGELAKLPFLKSCILEAIRLRSPGAITRKVLQPLQVYNYEIPAGDLLMLSPYWLHRDPKHFPEPHMFRPERWKKANLEKNVFLDGFVAFGGGKFQCPGRWFALTEIQILLVLMLYKYEFQLLDPVPKQSNLHLVGTQQPDGPCRVRFRQRK